MRAANAAMVRPPLSFARRAKQEKMITEKRSGRFFWGPQWCPTELSMDMRQSSPHSGAHSLSPLSARLTRSSLMHATVLSRAHATPSRLMSAACAWAWAIGIGLARRGPSVILG